MRLRTGVALATLAAITIGCREKLPKTLPESVQGVWTSDAARFEGRFLELRAEFLVIANGQDLPNKHRILEVESHEEGAYTAYRVTYVSDEGEGAFLSFFHTTSPTEVLELANQRPFKWTKRPEEEGKS